MRPVVILALAPNSTRSAAAAALRSYGLDVCAADTLHEALRLLERPTEVGACVLDEAAAARDLPAWRDAVGGAPSLAGVALLVRSEHVDDARGELWPPRTRFIPAAAGIESLVIETAWACGVRLPDGRVARGSERFDITVTPFDLHAYARGKLVLYLGATRAEDVMREITAHLHEGRIVTTADLHEVATRLRQLGDLEATIAALLSGRATLLDSDRTLRS